MKVKSIIDYWKKELHITDWYITTEKINPEQIIYNGEKYFIGITRDFKNKIGVIYHDIDLCEESIIHELLHVRFPSKSEYWVDTCSKLLVNNKSYFNPPYHNTMDLVSDYNDKLLK